MTSPRQAIALHYDGQQAPSLSAKGEDELAAAIIEIAKAHDVPIYENADLVRLLSRLQLGDHIPEALYLCIAEILAFAWHLKGKCPADFARRESEKHEARSRPALPAPPKAAPKR